MTLIFHFISVRFSILNERFHDTISTWSACNFTKKGTLAQVFSYEFCEISKNTFFTEHLQTTASRYHNNFKIWIWNHVNLVLNRILILARYSSLVWSLFYTWSLNSLVHLNFINSPSSSSLYFLHQSLRVIPGLNIKLSLIGNSFPPTAF